MSPPHLSDVMARPRTIAHVLLDLHYAKCDSDEADHDCRMADIGSAEEDEAADRGAQADQRIDALRAEFAELIAKSTGVKWANIEAAITEGLL